MMLMTDGIKLQLIVREYTRLLWKHYQILSIRIPFIDNIQICPLVGTHFKTQGNNEVYHSYS